nr:MAG TPA: hypothetical protein [Caudoviricetes sp.]
MIAFATLVLLITDHTNTKKKSSFNTLARVKMIIFLIFSYRLFNGSTWTCLQHVLFLYLL